MNKKIKIKINNKTVNCEAGITVMQAAKKVGISIPGLCSHPDFKARSTCRVCVVEIKGRRNLATSCSTLVEDGMEIITDNERVKAARNMNLELIFAEHIEKCADCIWRFECKLLAFAKEFGLKITKFDDIKRDRKTYRF